jgi:FSR family fosmidomycin resistance protein-like MFS transporter
MIPWLVTHRGLSLALAATLTLAANLFGSIVQPLFGYISDKRPSAWVIPVSIFLATGGTALIGFAPTLPLMLAGAVVSGIGVAAFHPESSRFSNYFAGRKRASGMSTFTVGGYLGFAVGPIVAAPLILAFGLPGVAFLLIPAAVVAGLLVRELPRFNEVRQTVHRVHRQRSGSDDWRGFSLMGVVVALRSTTFLAAVTFTPVFIMRVSGVHAVFGSFALFALLLGGAIGTMYGGRLADRIDRRRVITLSLALTAVFGALLALCGTYFHAYAVMTLLALGFGVSLGLSAGVLVVLGQEYLPKHIGVASGVTLGLANTIGGLAAPAFGKVGDDFGLVMVYVTIAVFAVLAFGGTFLMPKPQSIKQA